MRRSRTVFLVLSLSFMAVCSSIVYYSLSPRPAQPFVAFGIYSQNNQLAGYVQGFNQTVVTNETLAWNLQVANELGNIQLIRILYGIENLTTTSPNETTSALVSPVGYSDMFIGNGETETARFNWTVLRLSQSGSLTYLLLDINGQQSSPTTGAVSGRNFRFVFELWTFNSISNSFQYGWQGQDSRVGDWLQIWFSVPAS